MEIFGAERLSILFEIQFVHYPSGKYAAADLSSIPKLKSRSSLDQLVSLSLVNCSGYVFLFIDARYFSCCSKVAFLVRLFLTKE